MNLRFPSNPLETREVEPDFAEQAAAAAAAGFPSYFVSFEALVQEAAAVRAARRVPD